MPVLFELLTIGLGIGVAAEALSLKPLERKRLVKAAESVPPPTDAKSVGASSPHFCVFLGCSCCVVPSCG